MGRTTLPLFTQCKEYGQNNKPAGLHFKQQIISGNNEISCVCSQRQLHVFTFIFLVITILLFYYGNKMYKARVKSFCRKTSCHGFDYKLSRSL